MIPESVGSFYEDIDDYEYNETIFRDCSSLVSVTLPSSWKSLPSGCFMGCSSLESIVIPEGVSEIPSNCFKGCTSLTQVLHDTPFKRIGYYAFSGCASLTSFDLSGLAEDKVDPYPSPDNNDGPYDSSLGEYAFASSGLTSVVIPASVKEIESSVFENCDGLSSITLHDDIVCISSDAFAGTAIRNIDLPDNLPVIRGGAFSYCVYLEGELIEGTDVKALTIPASVEELGYYIFEECSNLKAVRMLSTMPPHAVPYALMPKSGSWLFELKAEDLKV